MSEKRETILRLLQDETGRITDVKVEQQPVPAPEYVLDDIRTSKDSDSYPPYPEVPSYQEVNVTYIMGGRSYKRVGEVEIPVPVASSNGEVEMSGDDGSFRATFHFDSRSRETVDEPGVYTFVPEVHQTEEGGDSCDMPLSLRLPPAAFPEVREVKLGYAETEEKTVRIRVRHMPETAYPILVDREKTSPWIHAEGGRSEIRFTCDRNLSPKPRSGEIVFAVDSPTPIELGSRSISVTQEAGEIQIRFRSSCTDAHLSDDKSRRFARVRLTVLMADHRTGDIINPDVPWTVTGSDDRVVVESVDEEKRELLLSTDAADTLETPVTVTLHLEDGSDITLEYPLFKEDLTPQGE